MSTIKSNITQAVSLSGTLRLDDLVSLNALYEGKIRVSPKWPYRSVEISSLALSRLEGAQLQLPPEIRLVLVRAFEPGGILLRVMHRLGREVGKIIFCLIYPRRRGEAKAIFSANGHTTDGNHVDVKVELSGELLSLLPGGVLTPSLQLRSVKKARSQVLGVVYSALQSSGFDIHSNPTEALQIHCDLVPMS